MMNQLLTSKPGRQLWPLWCEIVCAVYTVCDPKSWAEARANGVYSGAPSERQDGFIQFSTASQLPETLQERFAGRTDLVLLAVPVVRLGDALQWEPSHGGDLFPHLYGDLPVHAVVTEQSLRLDAQGRHILPDDLV